MPADRKELKRIGEEVKIKWKKDNKYSKISEQLLKNEPAAAKIYWRNFETKR